MKNSTNKEQSNWVVFGEPETFDLHYYFYLFRAQWRMLVLVSLLGAIAAFVASQLMTPVYRATTTLLVDVGSPAESENVNDIRTSEMIARTYIELVRSRAIRELVAEDLDADRINSSINASTIANTQVMRIQVEDTDPDRAREVANSTARALIAYLYDAETSEYTAIEQNLQQRLDEVDTQIADVQSQLAELAGQDDLLAVSERARLDAILSDAYAKQTSILREYEDVRLQISEKTSNIDQVDEAVRPDDPVRPNVIRNTFLGFMLGLLVASGYILGRELLDDAIRNPERLSEQVGLPILGRVLHFDAEAERLITTLKPRSPQAETFRTVRLNLDYVSPDEPLRSVLVTSAAPSEGKSTLSANLAIAVAQGGRKTILIDGDMRRPKVHRIFDVSNMAGLSNLFLPSANGASDSVAPTKVDNLSVIPSGPLPPNPSELFYSNRAGEIIQNAEKSADLVIIDTPPIATMTDATAISRHVDGVILAVRFGQTKRRIFDQALEALRQVDARVLGMVITDVGNRGNRYGYYYYNYRYNYKGYSVYYEDADAPKEAGWSASLKRSNAEKEVV